MFQCIPFTASGSKVPMETEMKTKAAPDSQNLQQGGKV